MSATEPAGRAAAYKRVADLLGVLRKSGNLPWSAALHLTRALDEWQTYASPREGWTRMLRSVDQSSDRERSLLYRFSQDCIIAIRGYDFQEGRVQ